MNTSLPAKRKRLPRSCTLRAKQQDIALSCDLMESIQDYLSKHRHDDADIQTLLDSIDIFQRKYQATRCSASHEQKEQDQEDEDDGIDLEEEDTWSDEVSEHESDRDFIAPSDEEEEGDASYVPSESEDESTQDTQDMGLATDDEEDKENEVP